MAQPYQDTIKGRKLEADTPAPVGYNPAANPIDTYAAPPKTNSALKLADALSGFNQALRPMVQDRVNQAIADETNKGKLGYLRGESPEDQSESYKNGYMALKWEDFGRQAALKINDVYAQAKEDPTLDVRSLVTKQIDEDLAGIQEDPRAIDAYLNQVIPLTESLALDFQKHHQGIRDQETDRMLMARAGDMVSAAESPEVLRDMIDNEYPTWMAMGKSKNDVAAAMVDSIIRTAVGTEDVSLLDALYLKSNREDGIPLATIKGVDEKAKATREGILKAQKDRLNEETYIARQMDDVAFEDTLIRNPLSEELNLENLMKHIHANKFLHGEGKLAAAWARVLKARQDVLEEESIGKYLMNNEDSMTWRRLSEDPRMKKWYHAETQKVWEGIDPKDPVSIANATKRLMNMHRLSGIPPRELVGIFSNIKTSAVDEKTGVIAPEMTYAMQIYRTAKDRGELAMVHAYAGEENMAYLAVLDSRIKQAPLKGELIAEAVRSVKLADNDPDLKRNIAVVKSKAFSEKLDKEVKDEMDGILWFGAMDNNVSTVQGRAQALAEQYVSQYRMSPEDAAKAAVTQIKEIYANDGHGAAFEVDPQHIGEKSILEAGMKIFLENQKAAFKEANDGEEMEGYSIFPNRDGKTYTMFNGVSGLPAATVSFEELKGLAHPVGYGTPMQRGENAKVLRTLKSIDFMKGVDPVQSQFIQDNEDAVIRLLASNDLSFAEKTAIRWEMKNINERRAQATKEEVKAFSDILKQGDILRDDKRPLSFNIPAKLAPGTPPNTGELAKKYYSSHPGAALAIVGEGFSTRAYKDQGGVAIGIGYNISTKTPDQVRKDFRAAGVPPQDIEAVATGAKEMTTDQVVKLFENTTKNYEKVARDSYGKGYDKLPPEVKAVLFDMAYNAGTPSKFQTVLGLFRKGDIEGASKNLTLKYKDANGNWKNNERRVQLWREMLSGDFPRVMDRYSGKRKAK